MLSTRLGGNTEEIAMKLSKRFILPIDADGSSRLSLLMLSAAVNQRLRAEADPEASKMKQFKILGYLDKEAPEIFKTAIISEKIPAVCHLKNPADDTFTLRKAKARKYEDISEANEPYIVCCIPSLKNMPIDIDIEQFDTQLQKFQIKEKSDKTAKRNQHCTHGAFLTTFHRDTMFSTKVHTLSPGSMKLWCFEKKIGQLDLEFRESPESQMLKMTAKPSEYDFFLQEPGEIVEHDGGYAHFVMTFNRHHSRYGQWCALIGWEINTPRQVHHSMRVETPLLQGRGGTLEQVSKEQFLRGCAKTTRMAYSTLMEQDGIQAQFLNRQQLNSQKRVDKLADTKERNLKRYAGLKSRAHHKNVV